MASLAEIVAFQTALSHLGTLSIADLVAFWRTLDIADAVGSAQAVREFVPDMLDSYVPVSAEIGAAFYDSSRDESGARGSFFAEPILSVDGDRTQEMIGWAVAPLFRSEPDPGMSLSRLSGGSQRSVAEGARLTISENVDKDPAEPRYARHASVNACAFCALIATRGAVFRSAASAGDGHKYHNHCHCVPVAVWPTERYEPPPYVKDWENAYVSARRDGGGMKVILSNMRADLGVH